MKFARTPATGASKAVVIVHSVNVRRPSGSYVVFDPPAVAEFVPIPARRCIKLFYVRWLCRVY